MMSLIKIYQCYRSLDRGLIFRRKGVRKGMKSRKGQHGTEYSVVVVVGFR